MSKPKPTAEQLARAKAEAQEVRDRVMGLLPPKGPKTEPKPKPKPKPRAKAPKERRTVHEPKPGTPTAAIVAAYQTGDRIAEIAREYDIHPDTVRNALKWKGVWKPADTSGPRPLTVCREGLHSMAEHGRRIKGGGHYCAPCKAKQGAEDYKKRQIIKAAEELAADQTKGTDS